MPNLVATKSTRGKARSKAAKLGRPEIQRRLEQIELTTISSMRALQMDIEGDAGVPSPIVLRRARAALK